MKLKLRPVLFLICLSVFLFSGWMLAQTLASYQQSNESYDTLSQYIAFVPAPTSPASPGISRPTEPKPDVSRWPQVDFEALRQINPDVIGWIYIENTNINYPIVQGVDNDHYLHYLFDGTKNRAGSIFLDFRCSADLSDRHSIIYGHHLKNKTMFSRLMRYKKQSFYDEHTEILIVTPDAYYSLRVFSGYVADNHSGAWDLDLSDEEHAQWIEALRKKSCFQTDYAPSPGDAIVTLSTCTYEFDNAKFLVHAYVEQVIERE